MQGGPRLIDALDIRVRGIVQGVGFRPFVYRLARQHVISGWVLNDLDGVFIHAEGESKLLDEFVTELHMNPPAAARITEVELKEVPLQDCTGFEIRESQKAAAEESTLVSADLATCADCLGELFDPEDRRYRYPFVNCTNCGPRFTIIDSLPYDRPATSMATFAMCDACSKEYADPSDRRFHAQPDACFECGPHIVLYKKASKETACSDGEPAPFDDSGTWGTTRQESDAILAEAVDILVGGGILAVKGLGGFHLACDAGNADALALLRARKHRDGKAFAVMMPDVDDVRETCLVSKAEADVLESSARPIVLFRKRRDALLAPGLADELPELGVMLPATPLQHLLLHDFQEACGRKMLVMTSGNVHDEPIVVDDREALVKFRSIADAIIGNDRPILSRYDDSVVRVLDLETASPETPFPDPTSDNAADALQLIRRARGYAPIPIALSPAAHDDEPKGSTAPGSSVFAAGSEQKNTFTFAADGKAYVSQHVGDMEDADVFDAWLESKARFEKLFRFSADCLACDLHPEYLASKWARDEARRSGHRIVEVQHHHAHIASVLGEHGLYGPCCGIAFDGTGYGADGAIWGGEVLLANRSDYERFANFPYMPMPGGAAAIKHPLRMAYGLLWTYDLLDHPGAAPALEALGPAAEVCEKMIESGLNTPMTSSAGRLFDAVSALLGICQEPTYEGEPAILLDAARTRAREDSSADPKDYLERYAITFAKNSATPSSTAHDTSVVLLDARETIRALLDDFAAGIPVETISLRFHDAMVEAVVHSAELVRALYGITLVVLSGGCFMNRHLVEQSVKRLGEAGFTVALNADLPPNDGCISYGQAVVASSAR